MYFVRDIVGSNLLIEDTSDRVSEYWSIDNVRLVPASILGVDFKTGDFKFCLDRSAPIVYMPCADTVLISSSRGIVDIKNNLYSVDFSKAHLNGYFRLYTYMSDYVNDCARLINSIKKLFNTTFKNTVDYRLAKLKLLYGIDISKCKLYDWKRCYFTDSRYNKKYNFLSLTTFCLKIDNSYFTNTFDIKEELLSIFNNALVTNNLDSLVSVHIKSLSNAHTSGTVFAECCINFNINFFISHSVSCEKF